MNISRKNLRQLKSDLNVNPNGGGIKMYSNAKRIEQLQKEIQERVIEINRLKLISSVLNEKLEQIQNKAEDEPDDAGLLSCDIVLFDVLRLK